MKTLIAYYSLEGNTRETVNVIAPAIGADVVELKPVKDIPKSGFLKFFVGGAMASMERKARLKKIDVNPLDYDRIIIGTPVWAGKPVPAVNTFINKSGVAEKITGVFTYSGSGNDTSCVEILKKKAPGIIHTATLVDKTNVDKAADNATKIENFVNELQN